MQSRIVLVTGATGTIGPVLSTYLLKQGYQVRTYSRHSPVTGLLPEGVQHFVGDITDITTLQTALAGVDTVFHLAAFLHIENPSPDLAAEYRRVNVLGTQCVAQQSKAAGVRRFVYFSTVKVYGIHQAESVRETTIPLPKSLYAKTKLDGEDAIRNIEGMEVVVLRLAAVFGGQLQGSWRRMIKAIVSGWFVPMGNLQNVRSLTYVEDVAQAAILVAEHPASPGNIYNLVGYESAKMQDILDAIYIGLNRRRPKFCLPSILVMSLVWLTQHSMALLGKHSPVTSETLQQFVIDETYSGSKLRQLGFAPKFSLSSAWKLTLEQLQE